MDREYWVLPLLLELPDGQVVEVWGPEPPASYLLDDEPEPPLDP